MKNKQNIKKVDCVLIFMLDEERDYFLQFNKQFIVSEQDYDEFKEFIFFDKFGKLRKGVIASNGTAMGNTEACALFYKISRKYTADLYINLGVAGIYKDVNIGDVVIVSTRLATLGEENATDSPWQLKDIPVTFIEDAKIAATKTKRFLSDFSENTKEQVAELKNALNEAGINDVCKFDENVIRLGACVSVPEVIKGDNGREKFPTIRKMSVIDMEAYYLVLWHALIKNIEPHNANKNSKILVFKSASDYGDINKQKFEDCGSRKLAMTNLCTVVSNYCTNIHDFPRRTNENIFTFFDNNVKKGSTDELVGESHSNFETIVNGFEELCSCFIETNDENFNKNNCVYSALDTLSSFDKKIILLNGRSGTAKSTFMSYLYHLVLRSNLKAILVDFSKYSTTTTPESTQLTYLLQKLLSAENDLYIFLDGIDVNAPYYNDLLSVLEKDNYNNISYCIGNIIGGDELYNIVPKRLNVTKIEFSGVSLYSNNFEQMLEKAEKYFKLLKHNFNVATVKDFIAKSKITNIDFRLLSMMSNHCEEIVKYKSLYTFLNNYIIGKFGRPILMQYRKSPYIFSAENNISMPSELMKFNSNAYATSLAVAQEIVDIFEKNDTERIATFVKSKFVLSDDMNLFFNHLLKYKQSNVIIDNIIDTLTNGSNEISICVETQLLYSISSIIKADYSQYERLKQIIKSKLEISKTQYLHMDNDFDHSWITQYRTLCIVLNQHFGLSDYLNEYNAFLLKDDKISKNNLNFHFLYYSKAPFTFENVNRFDVDFLSDELFFNTYYVLKQFLENSDISNMIIRNVPFAYMNIITYLHLINEVVIKKNRFRDLEKEIKDRLENIRIILTGIDSHNLSKPTYLKAICDLITLTGQKL